ncbi:TonB-dependent receptor domain-containing protein [Agaribacter marinus]|uniref:TonB-dependent receptor n=1 Tax=Agaribacter marinus TaxID=1431249 RepID=A0AA37SY17_9ALTE|nr:TonB-dependent receptor [Agaribacter marinus]GLR71952.1 TonB-dependent receptor [Agaribacter marinus]
MEHQFKHNLIATSLILAGISNSSFAHAQESTAPSGIGASQNNVANTPIEKVQVTGSRIKRYEFSLGNPVVVFGRDSIDDIGSPDLSESLLEIPSIIAGSTDENSTLSINGSGIQSVNLRNLGDNRTLTLIDGRRTVSESNNINRVSQSSMPSSFIEKIEVVTGGRSSVYGSDAVAGVINLITESGQQGFEIDVLGRKSNTLDRESYSVEVSYGKKFNDDKGYIFAAVDMDDRKASRSSAIPRTLIQADWDYDDGLNFFSNILGEDIRANEILPAEYGNKSADPDGGRFDQGSYWYDEDNVLRENFVTDRDGFDFRSPDTFQSPRERLNIGIKGVYEFSNAIEGFFTLLRSNIKQVNVREPEGDDYNDVHLLINPDGTVKERLVAGRIDLDNPFVPQFIRENETRALRWDRRFVEVGPQESDNDRTTTRAWAGLRGQVFDDWDWEASLGYGKHKQVQTRANEIDIVNLAKGLNAERTEDGTIQCADPLDRADGCVPVNLFGRGSITNEAADYIRANLFTLAEIEQVNFQAFMTGDLLELPAGPIGAAIGIEYRKDEQDIQPGPLNRRGGHSSGHVPAYTASIAVAEAFGELNIPIITDAPGIYQLSIDTSLRFANYDIDRVGSVTSFGTGLQYQPLEDVLFRANFNRALRAPDLTELFSPPRGDSDNVTDICDGVSLAAADADGIDGIVARNCLSEPGILAAINDLDSENPGFFTQESTTISGPNAGNPDLIEEEADTVTVGIVWVPEQVKGLSFSADYYDIEIKNVITALSGADILRECYRDNVNFSSNPLCNDVSRNPEDGQIENLVNREFNLNGRLTSGVDYSIAYDFSLEGMGIPGNFSLSYNHTHIIKLLDIRDDFNELDQIAALTEAGRADEIPTTIAADGSPLDGLDIDNDKGELVSNSFKDRGRFSLAWQNESWRISWRTNYFGTAIGSYALLETYEDAIEEFGSDAEEPLFLFYDRELIHNLSVRYTTNIDSTQLRISAGVNNINDNQGPFAPLGAPNGNSGNFSDGYGLLGRSGFVRVRLKF